MSSDDSVIRFTVSRWETDGINRVDSEKEHIGLIFSKMRPWSVEDMDAIIRNHEGVKKFLRFPDNVCFIIPCPPPADVGWETHPLTFKPHYRIPRNRFTSKGVNRQDFSEEHLLNRTSIYTGGPLVERESKEYRFIVTSTLESALSMELHPSTLSYNFYLVHDKGFEHFTYKELWDRCEIVQSIFLGYGGCPGCDLRGDKCIRKWFNEAAKDRFLSLDERNLRETEDRSWFSHGDSLLELEDVVTPKEALKVWNDFFKERPHATYEGSHIPTEQLSLGMSGISDKKPLNVEYISRGFIKKDPTVFEYPESPADISLDPEIIAENREVISEWARERKQRNKKHKEICGTGNRTCIFKEEGCNRWRGAFSSCNNRWLSEADMLEKGVPVFLHQVEHSDEDFLRSFNLSGHEFRLINPETGRSVGAYYAGLSFLPAGYDKYRAVHSIVRSSTPDREELFSGSWNDLRKFIRRQAPWESRTFDNIRLIAGSVTPEAKLLYAECSAPARFKRYGGGWHGWSAYDVLFTSVYRRVHYTKNNLSIQVHLEGPSRDDFYVNSLMDIYHNTWLSWFKWIPE